MRHHTPHHHPRQTAIGHTDAPTRVPWTLYHQHGALQHTALDFQVDFLQDLLDFQEVASMFPGQQNGLEVDAVDRKLNVFILRVCQAGAGDTWGAPSDRGP